MRTRIGLFALVVRIQRRIGERASSRAFRCAMDAVSRLLATRARKRAHPGFPRPMIVCVRPSGSTTGVAMSTFADGKRLLEQTVVADGVAHSRCRIRMPGHTDHRMVERRASALHHANLACNDRPAQAFSGLSLFAPGSAWIDIQAATDDQQQVRIRRYMRVTDQPEGIAALPVELATRAAIDAQAASAQILSREDVAEAGGKAAAQVVEAAIVETEARFVLDSRAFTAAGGRGRIAERD